MKDLCAIRANKLDPPNIVAAVQVFGLITCFTYVQNIQSFATSPQHLVLLLKNLIFHVSSIYA